MSEFGTNVRYAGEFVDEVDEDGWLETQRLFSAKRHKPQSKAHAKRQPRRSKDKRAVAQVRRGAFNIFRALGHQLFKARGAGVSSFVREAAGSEGPLSKIPCFVFYYDECSANLALHNYLSYELKMRVLSIRDVFHREWNETMLALKASGLWGTVLLTTVVYNLAYGPWDGSSWFVKMCEGTKDFVAKSSKGSLLFGHFYDRVCQDEGKSAVGGQSVRLQRLQGLVLSLGFKAKGPRVAIRRWFSWVEAAIWNDAVGHSRAIAIMCIGVQMKV